MNKKHVIWSEDINLEDWNEYLDEEFPEADEDERWRLAEMLNYEYLEDERMNLNIKLDESVILIADLGLWTGRTPGYRLLMSTNLSDCLRHNLRCQSSAEWYLDDLGDLCCREAHHDGTNYYTYRMWKPGTTEQQRRNLCEKLYYGSATRKDITRCTVRLGDPIAKVYGWKIRGMKKGA